MKKVLHSMWLSANLMALSATAALAQPTKDINLSPQGQFSKLGTLEPANLISSLIKLLLIVAAVVFFFMLVIGGIKWILSGGDKAKTEEARNQITAALVGLVIVFSAWAIAQLITALFGISIFDLKIKEIYTP